MNKFILTALSGALVLAFNVSTFAVTPAGVDYNASKLRIPAAYKADEANKADEAKCAVLAGNTRDICMGDASGREKIAKAKLEQSYHPSDQNHYDVAIAKANATYAVATEKCDEFSGNSEAVCDKEAKKNLVTSKADADVALKTANANAKAHEKTTDARMDAAEDKDDAAVDVAKEKCDVLSGDAKDSCINLAKAK